MADIPPELQDALMQVEDPKLREAIQRAAEAAHEPEALRLAEQEAKQRRETEIRERVGQLSRVADAALDGAYGRAVATEVSAALVGGKTLENLEAVAKIVAEAKRANEGRKP
jgi:hypothetical protein